MAQCPKCERYWLWDWEQDVYRYIDSSPVATIELNCIEKDMELETTVFKCKCGAINSLMYLDAKRGSALCSIEAWRTIDWEQVGNMWNNYCLDCNQICLNEEFINHGLYCLYTDKR